MKKFTNLEQEILKENANLAGKFNTYYQDILEKLDIIKVKVDNLASKQTNDPKNWGYLGDIAHVYDEVNGILEFLGNE